MADDKRQTVFVPLTGGMSTDADLRMRKPERLQIARNVRSPEIGTLGKRYGFSVLGKLIAGGGGAAIADNGPIRGLAATNKELLAIGHRDLFAYVSTLGGWMNRGHISPCVGDTREVFRANVQYEQADGDIDGNYIVQAAIRYEGWGDATARRSMEFRGVDVNGDTTFEPTIVERTLVADPETFPYACKVAGHGSGHVICWAQTTISGASFVSPGTLSRYHYLAATPYTPPADLASDITADLYVLASRRTFDVISIANGGYCVAYIDDTSKNVNLRTYNASHVLQNSSNIAGTYYSVALAEASDGHFYVLTVESGGEAADVVELWHRTATLGIVWGPILLETLGTLPTKETANNLGVVEGNNGSTLRAQCVWEVSRGANTSEMHSRSTNPNGAALDDLISSYNVIPYSRPWFYRNRAYVHAGTWTSTAYNGLGFEAHLLYDLDCTTTRTSDSVAMAALWGVGAAPGLTYGFSLGSANNVWVMPDAVTYRLMCPFLGEVIKATTVGELEFVDMRLAQDDVGFEFDASVTTTPLHRGSAIIGGGYVVWYDGSVTFELGFMKPPMVYSATQVVAGSIPDGIYTYSNLWKHVDAAGILHRSLPSPGELEDFDGNPKNVELISQSLPGSRRPHYDVTCEWYRAGTDNIPKRVNRSAENIPNTFSAATTQVITDDYVDARLYVQQYTVGGVLEAVSPEGARIQHVARERLWMGDFFRGDRIQYSKLVVPSTAGENAIAPELYEALGRISGDGERITGIGDMDATTVVFTQNHIYLVAGYGPDPRGVGDDTSRLTEVPTDAGCIEPRSVVSGPDGVFFQTDRGIYLLGRGHDITPIGEPIRSLLDTYSVVTSAVIVTSERQVRFTVTNAAGNDGRVLVFDYRIGAWFEWQIRSATDITVAPLGAAYVDSTYYIVGNDGQVYYEDSTTYYDNSTVWVPMTIETAAIQPTGPLRWMAAYEFGLMAEYKDDHKLTVTFYNDYSTTASTTKTWTDAMLQNLTDEANNMNLLMAPDYPKCEAVVVRITDDTDGSPSSGQACEIHGVSVDATIHGGLPRLPGEARQ
jgi:hypothetical protein